MVVRAVVSRAVSVAGAVAVAMALSAGLAPAVAVAAPVSVAHTRTVSTLPRAPKAPAPTAVQITGKFPGGKVTIRAKDDPRRFRQLLDEVSWLAGATPQAKAPRVDKLGPKFTIVVLAKDGPQHTYDVYPLAAGGPRAHRPAKQPHNRKVKAGWFYGQLTMSETLRVSGVPVADRGKTVSGGIGGGERVNRGAELDTAANVTALMTDMRRLFLLNGAVVLTIALGLALISFLIRRKV
jgi:uncharacterized Zn-binding protein involved in type VI secretion